MHSDHSREKILTQLQDKWLSKIRKKMLGLLSADAQKMHGNIETLLNTIKNGETEEALETLINKLKPEPVTEDEEEPDKDAVFESDWISSLREITKSVLNEAELNQEEARFRLSKSDSTYVKCGKVVKKTSRNLQFVVNVAVNSFRKIWKREEKPAPVWTHTIPLKNILERHLLGLDGWNQAWKNELMRLRAEVLLEAEAWLLHSTGLIKYDREEEENDEIEEINRPYRSNPGRDDLQLFFEKAYEQVTEIRERFTQKLDEKLADLEQEIVEAISLTGTFERSINEYSESKIIQKEKKLLASGQKNESSWRELLDALANRGALSMSFRTLSVQVKERIEGFSDSLDEFFNINILEPGEELREQLQEAIGIFEKSEGKSLKEIGKLSDSHSQKMHEHIESKLLKPLWEKIEDAVLSTKFDRFTSAVPEWTKTLREKAILIEKLDLGELPPKYELEEVDWQILVQRVINNNLAKEFLPKEVKPEQFLIEVVQGFKEISQIINTNLEIADEVKKSDEEEPIRVASEGLERAMANLDELSEKVQERLELIVGQLSEKQESALSKLAMLLEKQDVNEVRLAGAEYMAKETAVDWKTKLQVHWANVVEKTELFGRFIWKKAKQYFIVIRKFLGFTEREKLEGDKTDLATFLSETDEKIASLPFIYRRLFDFNKEVEDRFYIRRPEQFDRFEKGYELWQNNFPSVFAIIGEKGSGKSLFIRLLMDEVLTKNEVIEINFTETTWKPEQVMERVRKALKLDKDSTIDELIEAIHRKKKRMVVILENIQNCYIRNISGLEALEHLLFLISETNREILWITSCTRYGWLFLDKVLDVEDYFTHSVQTDNLTGHQIEDLIIKRHQASGYQLNFLPDDTIKKSRSFRKIMDDKAKMQDFLRDRYFEKLADLAEGNPSIAMIYWIRSIKDFDDINFNINPFEFGLINRIEELESDELFALAAFVLHDSLKPEELSYILHQPLRDCKTMISRLDSRSILVKSDQGYLLNHMIYRQVVRALKEANFIH